MVSHIDDETRDPALDERVRSVLDALAAPTEPGPLPGEVDAVAAFRAQHRTRRISMKHLTPFRVAVASAVGAGVFLTGGVAAAATGTLPGAAQDVAHEMIGALGIEVPAGEKASDEADERKPAEETTDAETTEDATETEEATETEATESEPADPEANDHGQQVREVAQDETLTGRDKGTAVSGTASQDRSRAGEQGAPEAGSDAAATDDTEGTGGSAPVEAPNAGGTGTADTATTDKADGASTDGTDEADESSSGRSAAGSDNSGRP